MSKLMQELKRKEIMEDPINLELINILRTLEKDRIQGYKKRLAQYRAKKWYQRIFNKPKKRHYVSSDELFDASALSAAEFSRRIQEMRHAGILKVQAIMMSCGAFDCIDEESVELCSLN